MSPTNLLRTVAVADVVCWAALAYFAHFYFTHACGA